VQAIRVLLIEDEEAVREISVQMLELLGCSVRSAADGTEGLRIYTEDPQAFDLLLIDQNLPGMTGLQVLEEAIKLKPEQKAILCSGDLESEHQGAVPRLSKPFRLADLKSMIAEVLERPL